ncbi:unnamed protein product [Thlaspi arvense]|uniref:Uncharacterized protein n=1 Tax=Thlaspi arvense TaxID=13288 RepID=A0AAU9S149_THLAR|nr:unnamed protein product [Thlaspi arvense]
MFSLRSLTSFVALPPRSKPSPTLRRRSVRCRLTEAASFAPLDVVSGESERAIASLTELQNGGGWKTPEEEFPSAKDGGEGREGGAGDDESEEEEGISSIHVPREKYISVSKSDLVDGIVTTLLDSKDGDADIFLLLASCLDSILHAEHKRILEQMRADFVATQSLEEVNIGGDEESSTSSGRETDSEEEVNSKAKKSEPRSVNGYEGLSIPLADGFDIWNFLISSGKHAKRRSAESVNAATRFQRSFIQLLDNAGFEELSARDLALTSALNTDYLLTLPVYVDWKKTSESNAIVFRRGYATEKQKGLLLVEKLDYIQSIVLRRTFSTISKPLRKVGKLINKALNEASQTQEIQDLSERMKGDPFRFSPPMRLAAQRAVSRPIFLSRMTLADIWKPASKKACVNDIWKRLKTSISILFSPSTLQEPAFEELILLYTKDANEKGDTNKDETRSSLQLEIFERIPIPDLPVIFPHRKLYRYSKCGFIVHSILLILYLLTQYSESIIVRSALFLDVIAVAALVIYATRVVLGYKQTWVRYQYKEAILTYAIAIQAGKNQVEMRVEKAISTLVRLGLVTETLIDGDTKLQAVPCAQAYVSLKELWNSLLG